MKNKFLSILLALCLCLTLLPTAALAEDAVTPDYSWYEDDTSASEFTISDINDLLGLANLVNGTDGQSKTTFSGKTIKLTADIDLSAIANWTPIGGAGKYFAGNFDGGNHTIRNLKVENTNANYQGLFGWCDAEVAAANIVIKDLTVSGSVSGKEFVGGVVGYCYGKNKALTVSNCHFSGTVTGTGTGTRGAGGVIGQCEAYSNSTITVENCTNSGTVSGKDNVSGTYRVGGVVGCCTSSSTCTITVTGCANSGTVTGSENVGGVVGYLATSQGGRAIVENCANSGTVTGSKDVGGVVGDCHATTSGGEVTVASCLNTGTVSRKEGSDKTTFGAVTGAREIENDKGTITVSGCYYLSGCAGTGVTFTDVSDSGDTGLTALDHKITTSSVQVYQVNNEAELRLAVSLGAKEIKLMNDIALTSPLTVTGENELTLDLNGRVLSLESGKTGSVIQVGSSSSTTGKLTLKDSRPTGTTRYFTVDESTGLWTLTDDETDNVVTGGVITGGTPDAASATGGGVYVYAGSSFTMTGGTVVGNTAHNGGGVYVDKVEAKEGTFTMTGGAIIGNTASSGGGVRNIGSFTMTGGSIKGNSATSASEGSGGGVQNSGTFKMTGGSISGNRANVIGGGVRNSGSFTMSGDSEISDNEAAFYGGGVYVGNGTFTMEGGSISGNKAVGTHEKDYDGNGGGVYVGYDSNFTMTGGSITGNSATTTAASNTNSGNGGGVYVEDLPSQSKVGTFNLTGGSITGNSATNHGYDVADYGSGNVSSPKSGFAPTLGTGSKTVTFKTDENTVYGVKVLSSTENYATEPAQAPTKPNDAAGDYTFGKWYEKENGAFKAEKFDFDNTTINGDLTLYAKWLRVIKPEHITVYIDGVKQTDQTNAKAAYDGEKHTVTFKIEIDGTTLENTDYTVTGDTTGTELRNYEFAISGKGNYAGGWAGGWQIVEASDSSVAPRPSYDVTVKDTENGTVTLDRDTVPQGGKVTITAEGDDGYRVGSVTAVDKNGNPVPVTKEGTGIYSAVVPSGGLTVAVSFEPEMPFADVPVEKYFYCAVRWANEAGIVGGTSATTFSPYASCTRGQLVTFLWRAAGEPAAKTANNPFTDVSEGSAFYQAILWASENNIVGGYDDGTFRPSAAITRQQAAAILYRYAEFAGMDVSAGDDLADFKDAQAISAYAVPAVRWAVGDGILWGSNGYLLPASACTRAQIVSFLYRFLG